MISLASNLGGLPVGVGVDEGQRMTMTHPPEVCGLWVIWDFVVAYRISGVVREVLLDVANLNYVDAWGTTLPDT